MKETLIVNLFGGPGISKSTTAAGVFHLLKARDVECELVNEFAKEKTWEKNATALSDQFFVTANQHYRQHIHKGQVDVIVTDSPILLGLFYYEEKNEKIRNAYNTFVTETFKSQINLNILLKRKKKFNQNGRNHNEAECREIDANIKKFLDDSKIKYHEIDGDSAAPAAIDRLVDIELSARAFGRMYQTYVDMINGIANSVFTKDNNASK